MYVDREIDCSNYSALELDKGSYLRFSGDCSPLTADWYGKNIGFCLGELTVVSAPTNAGKSTFLLRLATQMSHYFPVVYINCEDKPYQIAKRGLALAQQAQVPNASNLHIINVSQCAPTYLSFDTPVNRAIPYENIRDTIAHFFGGDDLCNLKAPFQTKGVVILDAPEKLRIPDKVEDIHVSDAKFFNYLSSFANKWGFHLIATQQCVKGAEKEEKLSNSDVGGSRFIATLADNILMVHRNKDRTGLEVEVTKSRMWKTDGNTITILFTGGISNVNNQTTTC